MRKGPMLVWGYRKGYRMAVPLTQCSKNLYQGMCAEWGKPKGEFGVYPENKTRKLKEMEKLMGLF